MSQYGYFKKMLRAIAPPILVILILGFYLIHYTRQYTLRETAKNNLNVLNQIKNNVELVMDEVDSLTRIFYGSDQILTMIWEILLQDEVSDRTRLTYDNLMRFLRGTVQAKPYTDSIYVYLENDSRRFIATDAELPPITATYSDISWYGSYLQYYYRTNASWAELRKVSHDDGQSLYLTSYRRLTAPDSGETVGIAVLNLKPAYFEELLSSLSVTPGQGILILDQKGNLLFTNDDIPYLGDIDVQSLAQSGEDLFTIKAKGTAYTVLKTTSRRYGWTYLSILPNRVFHAVPNTLILVFSGMILTGILSFVYIGVSINTKNRRRIADILHYMEAVERGETAAGQPDGEVDEYSSIISNMVKTFVRQNMLRVELSEQRYRQSSLEIQLLQNQINPHFLFNTLQTIYFKACSLTAGRNIACVMLEELSGMLRYSLDIHHKTASLKEELQYLLNYSELQKARFEGRFTLEFQKHGSLREVMVPKMLLQPLVENAILHGLPKDGRMVRIRVKAARKLDRVQFHVTDNGAGMENRTLSEIRGKLRTDCAGDLEESDGAHIGLGNVNRRLVLLYGKESALRIFSRKGLGTSAAFSIPCHTMPGETGCRPWQQPRS